MKIKKIFPDEFFKQFKTGKELSSFSKDLQERSIDIMPEGEFDAHLDYDKHNKREEENTRYSYSSKD